MEQGDVNERFEDMTRTERIRDMEALINEIVGLEALSRHYVQCDDHPEAADHVAGQAYTLLMSTRLSELPTVVLNIADKFNREHEIVSMLLDAMADAAKELDLAEWHAGAGRPEIGRTYVQSARRLIGEALDRAPYERVGDASDSDGGGRPGPDGH